MSGLHPSTPAEVRDCPKCQEARDVKRKLSALEGTEPDKINVNATTCKDHYFSELRRWGQYAEYAEMAWLSSRLDPSACLKNTKAALMELDKMGVRE